MRILHVTQPVDGGAPAVALQYAAHQRARGDQVVLASPPGWVVDRLPAGVEHVRWDARRSPGPSVPGESRHLARVVADVAPDVVHLHSSKAGLAGRLAVRGRLPTVFQPHAWSFSAVTGPQARLALAWERAATRWTDVHLFVSDAEAEEGTRHGVRPTRSSVVPNGIDTTAWAPRDREAARHDLGLPVDAPTALCVGRLSEQKGQDLLLAAWPRVLDVVPRARLVLVGDGPARASLATTARDLPGVQVAGARDDLVTWYGACDVCVVPSRWEGMALAPLEAMAGARPVVGFDVAGVRESIGPAGDPDAVVETASGDALARAVARRLADPDGAEAEGARQRRRVVEAHDVSRAAAAVTAIYDRLVSGRPRPDATAVSDRP